MRRWSKDKLLTSGVIILMVALPLVGVAVFGDFQGGYFEFPPRTIHVEHARFSRPVFIGLAIFIIMVVSPFVAKVLIANIRGIRRFKAARRSNGGASGASGHHPLGRAPFLALFSGIAACAVFWTVSWTRFAIFADFQIFTFTPLWLSYIIIVNSLLWIRTGGCIMASRPRYFCGLFGLSAVFWWFFEYLNRFTRNWHYPAIENLSAFSYFIFATLAFSTVLPAVLGTYELLKSFPRLSLGLDDFIKIKPRSPRMAAWLVLSACAVGLVFIGVFPNYLFPMLWVAPLGIFESMAYLTGGKTVLANIAEGNWRKIALLAFSALICGFFWEMWNWRSLAKWIYEVPFVNECKIFEMPILGYSGYLPFGVECAVAAKYFQRDKIREVWMKKKSIHRGGQVLNIQ